MDTVRDSFLDLERQRQRLEDQASQLRQSLGYWRTWDADYETLKEEIDTIPEDARQSPTAILAVKEKFESSIVTAKELDVIFGSNAEPKTYAQIISVLDGRIDTGSKNVASLKRGLESTENKLAATTVIMNPDGTDEDGQPFTDIIEELDDDDNVISYRLAKPGDNSNQIRELLEKAGVKGLPMLDGNTNEGGSSPSSAKESLKSNTTKEQALQGLISASPSSESPSPQLKATEKASEKPTARAKPPPPETAAASTENARSTPKSEVSTPLPRAAQRVQNIMDSAKAQEEISKKEPVIPENESEDDAQMRRDMLKYGLGEVGAVVAEMFIDDGDDDDWGTEDEEYESDESDEFGKSKYSVITDDYRQHMLELEKKLGFQSHFSRQLEEKIAAQPDDEEEDPGKEGIGRIVVQTQDKPLAVPSVASASPTTPVKNPTGSPAIESSLKKTNADKTTGPSGDGADSVNLEAEPKSAKKSVRFAEMLDIAPQKPGGKPTPRRAKLPKVTDDDLPDTIGDVVERNSSSKNRRKKANKKASRFKKAMAETQTPSTPAMTPDAIPSAFSLDGNKISGSAAAPTPPQGQTLAAAVVEKPTPASEKVIINDEFDELTLQQEVSDEYHKRRKNIIQQHGGFLVQEELPIQRVEEHESTKRVSRFKAARLSKQ
ncbi:hypothetical protein CFO_g1505 [Ceratocystis platani]|uniref:DUF3835 domain-containing protein n=1 Tax=Ceratocystis fimbriata f. sp. platani TaxID=88771 RepID=A0A0F8B3G8_CERFI|nr:hypothetical protein CFO_g1505 [Ceratocystis platani]